MSAAETDSNYAEIMLAWAEDGSTESLQQLLKILDDWDSTENFYQEVGDYELDVVIGAVADHRSEEAFDFLQEIIKHEAPRSGAYEASIENLVKFAPTHREEVQAIIETQLQKEQARFEQAASTYPFFQGEYYYDSRMRNYVDGGGNLLHRGSIINDSVKTPLLVFTLNAIGDASAYQLIQDHLATGEGLDFGIAHDLVHTTLKEKRYVLEVIDIYEELIRDSRYTTENRSNFVQQFFDNSGEFYFGYRGDPEEFLPQISDAEEKSLLRMLEVADYALTLGFLPKETVDLVYSKRAEIMDRLVGMGYSREEFNKTNAPEPETIEEFKRPEPAIEEPTEVVTTEPSEEPVEQSSNWHLWLIGVVVVVGGIALAVRRKN